MPLGTNCFSNTDCDKKDEQLEKNEKKDLHEKPPGLKIISAN